MIIKKEKIDFLIRYEHKVRELESIILLKTELERRGYKVAFSANYDYREKKKYDPRVIVSPAIYQESDLSNDLSYYGLRKKIANLLWEQVMGISEEESPTGAHNIYGTGQKVLTFCWGNNTKRRIVAAGVPEKNAVVVGQINQDLLKGPFLKCLKNKVDLAREYDINVNSRWNLFVSSFAYCELDDIQKKLIRQVYGDKYFDDFTSISNASRPQILKWFESVLKNNPHDYIIYRPHPDEIGKSIELKELELKYSNFRVISDLALKHWINAADKVYNWYSTGIIDAYILNKPCRILRPSSIPQEYDYRLFYTANQITSFEEFEEDYLSLELGKGIDFDVLSDYYYIPETFTYLKICDYLEEMIKTSKYDIHYSLKDIIHYGIPYAKLQLIKTFSFLKPLFRKMHLFSETFKASDAVKRTLDAGYEKNVATEEEIEEIRKLYHPIIYGESV